MTIRRNTCLRCGYIWIPRKEEDPKCCPDCNSPYWNIEKLTKSQKVTVRKMEKYYPCGKCGNPVQRKESKIVLKDIFDSEGIVIGRCAIPYHPDCYPTQ